MEDTNQMLVAELTARGYGVRIVSVERLAELEAEIKTRSKQGLFEPDFYQEYITTLGFETSPREIPSARSIMIVALPRPQWGLRFNWKGETKTLIMPPIYVGYDTVPLEIEAELNSLLASTGYRALHSTRIPLKLLAVRSGLAKYGRNNIVYVPGMGSYLHLVGLYSDLPCEQDEWQEARMLDRCQHCRACIIKCPNDVISDERFLIRAERCLAFHNERPTEFPFPEWIHPSWHNCLIGCLICQKYCPENRHVKDRIEILAEFSAVETAALMNPSPQNLSPATIKKLNMLQRPTFLDEVPRNLRALVAEGKRLAPMSSESVETHGEVNDYI